MKMFFRMVLGLTLFLVVINYHSPPIVGDANNTTIENPGDFVVVNTPIVELRAAEVVIKGPGLEGVMITNLQEEVCMLIEIENVTPIITTAIVLKVGNEQILNQIGNEQIPNQIYDEAAGANQIAITARTRVLSLFESSSAPLYI